MPFTPSTRNYKGIAFEKLRQQIDGKYNQAHDELSAAYYDYWKAGRSCPWQGYDVQPTPEESKALFDKLHGLIFAHYSMGFHIENLKQPIEDRIPEEEYNEIRDKDMVLVGKRSEQGAAKIALLSAEGIEIVL